MVFNIYLYLSYILGGYPLVNFISFLIHIILFYLFIIFFINIFIIIFISKYINNIIKVKTVFIVNGEGKNNGILKIINSNGLRNKYINSEGKV